MVRQSLTEKEELESLRAYVASLRKWEDGLDKVLSSRDWGMRFWLGSWWADRPWRVNPPWRRGDK
jgi:hypothetical protein